MSKHLLNIVIEALLENKIDEACAAISEYCQEKLKVIVNEDYKFDNVYCSQCGKSFGPGDHGFSHCKSHKGLRCLTYPEEAEIEAKKREKKVSESAETRYEYHLYVNYGQGWEDVHVEDSLEAIKKSQKEYQENSPQYPTKIKKVREKVSESVEIVIEGVKNNLSPFDAKELLRSHGGEGADFHALSREHVDSLIDHAKKLGYHHKSSHPGSRGRMFHEFLKKHAKKYKRPVKESEEKSDVPLKVRTEYAHDYAKLCKTAKDSKKAEEQAYKNIENRHGKDVCDKLKTYHKKNLNEGISDYDLENPDTVTSTALSAWGSYLINGNKSGIENPEELDAIRAWLEWVDAGYPVDCDDIGFLKRPDSYQFWPYGGDCQEYHFIKNR